MIHTQALDRSANYAHAIPHGGRLTADGEPVETDLTGRMIAIDAEQMRAIPEVIVIAYGTAKLPALRAALRSGLVGGVVTHTALARALLAVP